MISRRGFIYSVAGAQLALTSGILAAAGNTGNNPTSRENQNTGDPNWQIGIPPYRRTDDVTNQLRGYASATSINKGESIIFYITANLPDPTYDMKIYRVGWYGGVGGQLKLHVPGLVGVSQPAPSYDASTGLVACAWSPSYTLNTSQPTLDGTGWTSGIYLALLTGIFNFQTWIIFVIRDDARVADIMFQQSVTTYQAYNNYPADGLTGKSLYDGGSYGPPTALGTHRAVKVSFDRPYSYTDYTGAGELLHYDIFMVRWLERNGYDVCYSTNIDTHTSGARLKQFKAFLSVGHDEYWSKQMYDNAYAARDAGTSLGFFAANAVNQQIRLEPSTINGAPNRVVVGYKDRNLDPVFNPLNPAYNPSLTTVAWREAILNRPEQQLQGVMYSSYINADLSALPYVVQNSQTPNGQKVYGGTGLADGSIVPAILGYEFDKLFPNYNSPVTNTDPASRSTVVPGSFTLLSNSQFVDVYGNSDHCNSSIYQTTSGAWVFSAGTMYWNWGLDSYMPPPGIVTWAVAAPSSALQAATANILNLFIGASPLGAPSNLTATPGGNGVTLNWQNNAPTAVANTVQRSADNTTWITLTSALPASATIYLDSNASGSLYYRLQATDSAGSASPFSNTATVFTLAGPSGLTASPAGSSVTLNWQNNAPTATAFTVQRSLDNTNWITLTSTVPAATPSFTDANAIGAFYYRVQATDSGGHISAYSNVVNTVTLASPSNLAGTAAGNAVTLTWQNNAPSATAITVQRSADNANWTTLTSTLAATATTYIDNGATGVLYYRVRATDSTGHVSAFSNTVNLVILAAPTILAATLNATSVTLTWQNNAPSATAITVQRSPDNANWTTLTSTLAATATTYIDNGATGVLYYRVRATDAAGQVSAFSNTVNLVILAAPTNLAATLNATSITLTWQNNAPAATANTVQRSPDNANWTTLTSTLAATAATYTDNITGSFYYRVQATDSSGHASPYSNVANTVSLAAPSNLAATTGATSVTLTWQNNAAGATALTVQRSPNNTTWTTLTSTLGPTVTTYTDNGVTGTLYYRVRAADSSGHVSAYSNTANAIILAAPTNLAATTTTTSITLTWKNNAAPAATANTVQRSTDNATWTTLTSTLAATATTYTNSGISGSFYYRVQATDASGHASPFSNTVQAATQAATGPVAYWKMDEGTGTTTADASGNGNTGTLINAVWAAGSYGNSIAFSGSNSYVSVPESTSIAAVAQLTVSFWMYPQTASGTDPRVVSKLYTWDVKLNGSNRFPQFSSGARYAVMNTPSQLGQWRHIVFTYASGVVKGYVNGAPATFSANTFTGTGSLTLQKYGLYIGTDPSLTASFAGNVDDVRLYARALSAAEVLDLYTSTPH